MAHYTPHEPYSASIVRPACPKCSTRMMLARVSYLQSMPNREESTFHCPKCGTEMSEITRFK